MVGHRHVPLLTPNPSGYRILDGLTAEGYPIRHTSSLGSLCYQVGIALSCELQSLRHIQLPVEHLHLQLPSNNVAGQVEFLE